MNFQPLKYIFQSANDPEARTLLLLHGTGGDERDLLPLAAKLGTNSNVLSVRGNVTENGMPRFFKRLGMGIFDEEDLRFHTAELAQFIRDLAKKENFTMSGIVALGYSNGANIAGSLLMLAPDLLAGAMLLRPMAPYRHPEPFQTVKKQPVLLLNGQFDPTIESSDTEQYEQLLQKSGYNVQHITVPLGHEIGQEDLRYLVTWYQNHFPAIEK